MKFLLESIKLLYTKPRKFFFNLKIRYKLVFSYFLVTVIPVAVIGFLSYNSTLSYIKSQYIETVYNTQQQFNVNINNRLNSYMYIADAVSQNSRILSYFDEYYADYYREYDIVSSYITPVLDSLLESTGKDKSINLDLIKYENSNAEVIRNFFHGISDSPDGNNNGLLISTAKAFNIINMSRISGKDWFKTLQGVDNYMWGQISDDAQHNRVTYIKFLGYFPDTKLRPVGYILITVMLKDIINDQNATHSNINEFNMVFDKSDRILSSEDSNRDFFGQNRDKLLQLLQSPNKRDNMFLGDYLVVKGVNEITGWKILSAFPIKQLNENARKTRNTTIFYCFAALLILFIITYLLSNSFSRRITRISVNMNRFQNGSFDRTITDNHSDEIGYLARSFNEMTTRIKDLINDNYQANIDKKEAQLKALQAQINPHFLYNSLSSISRLGNIGDSASINKMVRALTTFYRMTLNKGRDIITISDEIEQIKAYIDVYKIRKGEDFNFYLDIDENILECRTIKVILQPFVENVLEHAMFNRENPINIRISVKSDDLNIVFKIIDDGVGIKPERLKTLFTNDNSGTKGYGIKNVDDRIKLQYGNIYGVSIYSRIGVGTTVIIVIPKLEG